MYKIKTEIRSIKINTEFEVVSFLNQYTNHNLFSFQSYLSK